MAAYCCLHPETLGSPQGAPPFRFALIFSAFMPRDPAWSLDGGGAASLRTFHCFGLNDPSVPHEASRAVAARFDHVREHEHAGGHGVPSEAALRTALKEFITACMSEAPSTTTTQNGGRAGADANVGAVTSSGGRAHAVAAPDPLAGASDDLSWRYAAWRQLSCR